MPVPRLATPGLFGTARETSGGKELAALVGAVLIHGLALAFVRHAPVEAARPHLAALWVDVAPEPAPPPPPEPVEPTPSPSDPPESAAPTSAAPVSADARPASEPNESAGVGAADEAEAAPLAEALGASDWEMLSGHGSALRGGGRGKAGGGGTGRTTTIAPRDFSREPVAPYLQPWVDRNFPGPARMYKQEGVVAVSALIHPNGTPSDVRVESVNPEGRGFGEACTRSLLQGPAWQPKLNRDGRPLPARVTYTCRFRLSDAEKSSAPTPATSGVGANRVWTRSAGSAP